MSTTHTDTLSVAIVKAIARSKRTRVDGVAYWPRETKAAKRLVYTVQLGIAVVLYTRNHGVFYFVRIYISG